ncbi:STAGA complex 65 subunit gamma-like [Orussus abietinus]|uniref:STAGA complex 65 subunit gamma-like n=1 Tax=Orussus abietinus TaxID=222816 RepID=UPI0006253CB7|nr:STAGA complex 65 subunit gamma-like [Orussus abietinus]XP_012287385.1 STAGA complex 65 subunit gamma-like [Orussus abietinus]
MKTNKSSGSHWGELPARETHKQEVITPDIIENVWRQVMEESNGTDCDYQVDGQPDYIQLPMGNLHVLNTINLHQQLRTMEDDSLFGGVSSIELPTCLDQMDTRNPFHIFSSQSDRTEFKGSMVIQQLHPTTAHKFLRHAVITLLAHIGFESASDIAIETLTDVANHFLRRMTLLLKLASEREDHGFPDPMERVLVESGIGGAVALYDYYQEYVLKFEQNMKTRVEKLAEEQRLMELNATNCKMELDEAASKLQFEELDEFGNVYREVPTLQLPDPEMGFPPSLDAGFQMLHSLEQDELNSLEVEEEEVNVSNSPNAGQQRNPPEVAEKRKKLS